MNTKNIGHFIKDRAAWAFATRLRVGKRRVVKETSFTKILLPSFLRNFLSQKRDQAGQGLIEYVLVVALVAITSMAIMRVLGQTVSAQLATITNTLQGHDREARKDPVHESYYKKKDMGDFLRGAASDGE